MGDTPDTVPNQLKRGEPIDVVIMVGYAPRRSHQAGQGRRGRAGWNLAESGIGVVVRAGAPKPDVSTVEALKQALLAAKSVAYSDSASSIRISNEMFKKMGIEAEMAGKARMIPAEPVGAVVARGEAEIGFQQISELKPIKGIQLVGPVPAEVPKDTIFSAGVVSASKNPKDANGLIRSLASPKAAHAIVESGLEPMAAAAPASVQ